MVNGTMFVDPDWPLNASCGFVSISWASFYLFINKFSFSALKMSVGWQEGDPACKKLGIGLLVMIWLKLCTSHNSSCHNHILHPIKSTTETILIIYELGCSGKWQLNDSFGINKDEHIFIVLLFNCSTITRHWVNVCIQQLPRNLHASLDTIQWRIKVCIKHVLCILRNKIPRTLQPLNISKLNVQLKYTTIYTNINTRTHARTHAHTLAHTHTHTHTHCRTRLKARFNTETRKALITETYTTSNFSTQCPLKSAVKYTL